MQWTDIQGMDQAAVDALFNAGIANAAGLAAVEDEGDLARRAGLPAARVLSFCQQARERVESALAGAGVSGPDDLARADPDALAAATGLPAAQLQLFVEQARKAVGAPATSVGSASGAVPAAAPVAPDAILLLETSSKARVRVQGAVTEVPILTARATDDAEALLASSPGDAVVLQEWANRAPARVNGQQFAPLPLFRIGGEHEERVRVAALKAPPAPAPESAPTAKGEKSFLGRFRKK